MRISPGSKASFGRVVLCATAGGGRSVIHVRSAESDAGPLSAIASSYAMPIG